MAVVKVSSSLLFLVAIYAPSRLVQTGAFKAKLKKSLFHLYRRQDSNAKTVADLALIRLDYRKDNYRDALCTTMTTANSAFMAMATMKRYKQAWITSLLTR